VGLFRRKDAKPKSMFFPEPSSSGVEPKRLAAGMLAQGQVLSVDAVGRSWSDGPGGLPAPFCNLTIQVRLEGVPPYEATFEQSIPGMKVSQVQTPGAVVAVRVNPDDHADVAIDFQTDPRTSRPGSGSAPNSPAT
jgi:hypothetical protein